MDQSKKTLLEKRIEQFCESSTELLTGIHTRYNAKAQSASKRKKRGRNKELMTIPDLDVDFNGEDLLEDML